MSLKSCVFVLIDVFFYHTDESSRVHLTSIHEVSSSDYINANFVHVGF